MPLIKGEKERNEKKYSSININKLECYFENNLNLYLFFPSRSWLKVVIKRFDGRLIQTTTTTTTRNSSCISNLKCTKWKRNRKLKWPLTKTELMFVWVCHQEWNARMPWTRDPRDPERYIYWNQSFFQFQK